MSTHSCLGRTLVFKEMDLFSQSEKEIEEAARPLAERVRPKTLEAFVGQVHLIGKDKLLRRAIDEDRLFSVIFWGPPGSGKTTLARIMAGETKAHFETFSAVLSGVKEIRSVIDEARAQQRFHKKKTPNRLVHTGFKNSDQKN